MVIIFLALIRCIAEPLRLQHYSQTNLGFMDIRVYLIGAMIAAIALFVMTVVSFWHKYIVVIALAIITLISLLIVKWLYVPL